MAHDTGMNDVLPMKWRPLRSVLRLFRDIDGGISRLMGRLFPTQYIVKGQCKRRGICCHHIAVALHHTVWSRPALVEIIRRYYIFVYNFSSLDDDPRHRVLVFKCNYLTDNGQCGIYTRRPPICRRYPQPRYFGKPSFLPGCGYYAIPSNSKGNSTNAAIKDH
ncbi:hypothetical protein EB093_02910 [bacterium]|nr:hypothetical protein [bacterium]